MRFQRLAKRTVYSNPWIRFEAHDIVHPNGTPGEHGVVIVSPASAVVVYGDDRIYLTQQARFAIDRVVLEVVKGGSESGEDALAAAQRETREELGFTAGRWDSLGMTYELPSIVAHAVELFLARDLAPVPAQPEQVESIRTVSMPFADAVAAVYAGDIADAVTGVAILRAAHLLNA